MKGAVGGPQLRMNSLPRAAGTTLIQKFEENNVCSFCSCAM
jgi:hypothetical protein